MSDPIQYINYHYQSSCFASSFSLTPSSYSIEELDLFSREALLSYSLRFSYSFMNQTSSRPIRKTPKQKPSPPADCAFDSPCTISDRKMPRINPAKLPMANKSPAAAPSPTGKAVSQANYSMIGTKGMRKKEL